METKNALLKVIPYAKFLFAMVTHFEKIIVIFRFSISLKLATFATVVA